MDNKTITDVDKKLQNSLAIIQSTHEMMQSSVLHNTSIQNLKNLLQQEAQVAKDLLDSLIRCYGMSPDNLGGVDRKPPPAPTKYEIDLYNDGSPVAAIKAYRSRTCCELLAAKQALDIACPR